VGRGVSCGGVTGIAGMSHREGNSVIRGDFSVHSVDSVDPRVVGNVVHSVSGSVHSVYSVVYSVDDGVGGNGR